MAVLVTGGAGYIGSHMVLGLLDAGEDVVVFDNLSTGHRRLVDPRAIFVEGDLNAPDGINRCLDNHSVDAILHFAGSIIVPESVADPLQYYKNNTAASRNLIEAAVTHQVRHFIFSSTAAVYGSVGSDPVTEATTTQPESPYGTSKLMTEWMLRDVALAAPLTYGVLRYFNVAGADPKGRSGHCSPNATHLIKVACKAALGQRDHIAVFGSDFDTADGTGVRDYIHVSDLVDAHALMLRYLREGGDSTVMNCGYGVGSSVREVIAVVKEVSGVDFDVQEAPRRPGDPAQVIADSTRLRSVLDWRPQHNDLRVMVKSAYDWDLKMVQDTE